MNGRYFIVGCLVGALLVAIVYIPLSGGETIFPYDPWEDINDDGVINILDIVNLANSYGTTGDPTKNVVVRYNWTEGVFNFSLTPWGNVNFNITTGGFRKLAIGINAWSQDNHRFYVLISPMILDETVDPIVYVLESNHQRLNWTGIWGIGPGFFKIYEVAFSELMVWIFNNSTSYGLNGEVHYYLTT